MILQTVPAIITSIFLIYILSYYILFFVKPKQKPLDKKFDSITFIVPAHNEEKYVKECIESIKQSTFEGTKQIIAIDDGSSDSTYKILKSIKGITVLQTEHLGKANALNAALKLAKGQVIAVVDADSIIYKDAASNMLTELRKKNTAAACGVVKVRNRTNHLMMWVHIEQLYNSVMRLLFSKINANVVTPGPLSMYRTQALKKIGGFSTNGFSEDIDVTVRLIRQGYHVGFAQNAYAETVMPDDVKGFFRQRTRFARGIINILKKHLSLNKTIIDIYTLPFFLFSYIQAVIMGALTIYQLSTGYVTYFLSQGIYFNMHVLKFFFEWFSIVGFIKWTISILSGTSPLTYVAIVGIVSTLLTYPLYIFSIIKIDKKVDIYHILPVLFMFPFWLLIMMIYIACLPEYFKKDQYNIWKKNEK